MQKILYKIWNFITGSKPEVIFLIGLPGASKKHYAELMKDDSNYKNHKVVSIDSMIELTAKIKDKTYDEIVSEGIDEIEEFFMLHIETAVNKRESIIINNHTNISKESRAKILKLIPDFYYKKAIVFYTSRDDIKNRLGIREENNIISPSYETAKSWLFDYAHPDKKEFNEIVKA